MSKLILTWGSCRLTTLMPYIINSNYNSVADQYIGVDFWYAANLESGEVRHIPKPQGVYYYIICLSVDTTNNTLLAIEAINDEPGHVNYLNSFNMTTGHETHIMDVTSVAMLSGDGYTYDNGNQILYTLTLDKDSQYQNTLNIINIEESTIKRRNISCQYKLENIHYDPTDDNIYAFEYESGWMDLKNDKNQPQNQTVYIGRINIKTWKFERLVSAVVPFYSNEYMTAYSPMRGYYVLAWPEPDYDPYVSNINGVLQIIDVRSSKVLYNDQVKGWTMRGAHNTQQNMLLMVDIHFSD